MPLQADIVKLLTDAAKGVAWMIEQGFAHRDVAARNVFCAAELDAEGNLKHDSNGAARGLRAVIADFGRAVKLPAGDSSGKVLERRQPLRDQPPEVLVAQVFTKRSDSFSFAVMAWAAMNASQPWPNKTGQEAATAHVAGQRMALPSGPFADKDLYETVITKCWCQKESERLEMQKVVELIDARWAALQGGGEAKEDEATRAARKAQLKTMAEQADAAGEPGFNEEQYDDKDCSEHKNYEKYEVEVVNACEDAAAVVADAATAEEAATVEPQQEETADDEEDEEDYDVLAEKDANTKQEAKADDDETKA